MRGCSSDGLQQVLPHLSAVAIESVQRSEEGIVLRTRSRTPWARCPRCTERSVRIHGRYERRLTDAPLGGVPVVIVLLVRRFKCLAVDCPAVTFAEQIPGLLRFSRRGRWVDGQSCRGETAVDETGPELNPA
ncbi:transposase family protein [Streptomyces sp. NPDC051658]|uniref:transposase family protein n=1 Tax=Streptomyces sp. NPDC051658 TaxID=3365667 RepID=UPI00378A3A0B